MIPSTRKCLLLTLARMWIAHTNYAAIQRTNMPKKSPIIIIRNKIRHHIALSLCVIESCLNAFKCITWQKRCISFEFPFTTSLACTIVRRSERAVYSHQFFLSCNCTDELKSCCETLVHNISFTPACDVFFELNFAVFPIAWSMCVIPKCPDTFWLQCSDWCTRLKSFCWSGFRANHKHLVKPYHWIESQKRLNLWKIPLLSLQSLMLRIHFSMELNGSSSFRNWRARKKAAQG